MHNPLLKASQMTARLFDLDPVVLALRQGGDLDCFLLVDEDELRSELNLMTVVGAQNLLWKSGGMTHCFGSLGCWVTIYEWTSIASESRASFQS